MRLPATVLAICLSLALSAQNAYEIKVTLKPFKNQYIYLGHYYGKQLPIIDSVLLNDKSEAVFKGTKKLGGGIYLVGYPDRAHNFEFLIDKNQKFSVVADTSNIHTKFCKLAGKCGLSRLPGFYDEKRPPDRGAAKRKNFCN